MCKAFDRDSLFIAPIRRKFCKAILQKAVLQFEKLMEPGSLYLGPLHSSFPNLLFWTICMSPVTICPWFGSKNGNVVQLQDKFILFKMFLVTNAFINSLWLNILYRIVLVNVYTVDICCFFFNSVGTFSSCFYHLLFY